MGADFYTYYPVKTSRRLVFLLTWSAMWTAFLFACLVGVAIATGVASTPKWNDAYAVSSGALLLACYDGLGSLGGLCVVILALGGIANMAVSLSGKPSFCIRRWIAKVYMYCIEPDCST